MVPIIPLKVKCFFVKIYNIFVCLVKTWQKVALHLESIYWFVKQYLKAMKGKSKPDEGYPDRERGKVEARRGKSAEHGPWAVRLKYQ